MANETVSSEQVQSLSMAQIAELLLRQNARDLLKEQQELDKQAAQQAQLERNAREENFKFLFKQTTCNHLKGVSVRGAKILHKTPDPNVYRHTFIDGSTYIKCMNCHAKWVPKDTVEYLYRGGKYISNHTQKGWKEAVYLMSLSTNQASSSEIPVQVSVEALTANLRSASSEAADRLLPRDKDGNEVSNVQYS